MLLHTLMVASLLTAQVPEVPPQAGSPTAVVEATPAWEVKDTRAMAPDGPVAADEYVVGPGDGVLLSILGEQNLAVQLRVGPAGSIVLPEGGVVDVRDMTIAEVEVAVRDALEDYYHHVELLLTLVSPRSTTLHVTGAVERPGSYEVLATTRISRVIEMAGGPLPRASLRGVELRGDDGGVVRADLASYANAGDLEGNPMAARGNIVHVPFRSRVFEIVGAVNVPGMYGLLPGDRLSDAISVAGGARRDAMMASVEFVRFSPDDPRAYESEMLDLSEAAWEQSDLNRVLTDGDRIYVRRDDLWHVAYRVEVSGEATNAGHFAIIEGEDRLTDVIERAGGFTDWADLDRASLTRRSPSAGETAGERELAFLMESDRGSLTTEEASFLHATTVEPSVLVSVDFRALFEHGEGDDPLLRGGDVIDVPRRMDAVRVSGAVATPGYVDFVDGGSIRDYVDAAGGYAPLASRRRVSVVRSITGQRVRATTRTPVRSGDTVFVPRREATDWLQVTKDVLSIAGQVATIYIVIDNISQ